MNNNQKHKWTRDEDIIVTLSYKYGLNKNEAQSYMPSVPLNSIMCKFQNCKYLNGESNSFSHCSKQHKEIWNSLS
jgi:hypothetical protein